VDFQQNMEIRWVEQLSWKQKVTSICTVRTCQTKNKNEKLEGKAAEMSPFLLELFIGQ
jgi:hypothetical protein